MQASTIPMTVPLPTQVEAVGKIKAAGHMAQSSAYPETAKVGLTAPRVIKPPPGLPKMKAPPGLMSNIMATGDNVAENQDCCSSGFASPYQEFPDCDGVFQEFYSSGSPEKDSNYYTGSVEEYRFAHLTTSHETSTTPALDFQNLLWSTLDPQGSKSLHKAVGTDATSIWGENSILGQPLDVRVTA
eukprot:gnl/MRDRNA2_/MRDRNA2_171431_c0_seq1.p1 gnl/MRDRNA2_/MRDRNA2_171431_c0~~gnl/MRDRNA2_/MRDRNA2_171431_c0_seq1.p1  ORF type:complete len:186 (+),score=30.90 gnl/MRDRNA2_/MRDRNA2_171431_c0_seq1:75-632(+)